MKNKIKFFLIIVVIFVIWFEFTACPEPETSTPVLTGMVSISGITEAGQILTANTNSLGGNGTISYNWKKENISIGTDSSTYIIQTADAGFTITVTVTRAGYTGSVTSQAIGPINIPVTFTSLIADGSETQTSTQLTLTFSQAITGLTADDITLSGVSGVTKGTLSSSGAYILPISGFTSSGTLNVSVASPAGYNVSGSPKTVDISYVAQIPIRRVLFYGPTETVTLNGLSNNDIYLVKVNASSSVVSAANTGGSSGSSPSLSPNIQNNEYTPQNELPRMGHPAADEFNANPPPIDGAGPRGSRAVFVPPVVGDTRIFWVESYYNSRTWVQKQATLRAAGQFSNIWIMDENYGSGGGKKVTTAQAQTLAAKFDLIYPIETNLLGYEYGGEPGGDGGRDGDPKIQILVYSIVNASGVVQAGGFFWSKDFYAQIFNDLLGYKTNLAEILYVDASQVNNSPDYTYSLLVHEFQHMINFNVKFVKQGKNSETWYNEMLSLMAEDIIAPLIGIGPANWEHPINQKIPTFLNNYHLAGITEWGTGTPNQLSAYYAKGYAFGAYLLRNYGGASLLQEMLANNSTNIASVTAALRTVNEQSGLSFEEAFRRYGEAMVFSGTMPADAQSFDKTIEKTIGSYTYTASKFNIWSEFGSTRPKIFDVNEQLQMRPYSITLHQAASGLTGQSGTETITLQRPNDPSVEFYLMVK